MGRINELSMSIANLIAAGEVVSRPANAIKELCENSIDAGATRISVEIQRGGISLMRVTDNGSGMDAEDLLLSVKRHATSKIRDESDLERIMTMGFRGEALPSIASVTKMRIVSKTDDEEFGHMLTVNAGVPSDIVERGAATGTTVICEDLFANVPARRKFLKRDAVEAGAVISAVEKLALSHPDIAFSLISDGVMKLETSGSGDLSEVIYTIFGKEVRGKLLGCNICEEGISISGFVGSPMLTRANRTQQFFFVNGRSVTSPMMSTALTQAYSSYIPEGKFPFAVIFLKINPLAVDVNIHPAKLEVKFINESAVFGALYRAAANALSEIGGVTSIGGESEESIPFPRVRLSEMPAPLTENEEAPREKRQLDLSAVRREAMTPRYTAGATYTPKDRIDPLAGITPDTELSLPPRTSDSVMNASDAFEWFPRDKGSSLVKAEAESSEDKAFEAEISLTEADIKDSGRYRHRRIIGEIFNKYLLVEAVSPEGENKFLIIDKHAAHERMLFETLKQRTLLGKGASQMLLIPSEIAASVKEAEDAENFKAVLEKYGFKAEISEGRIRLLSIPHGMDEGEARELYLTLLSELSSGERTEEDDRLPASLERALFTVACKAAIKGGREYVPEMQEGIVDAVLNDPRIKFCPHGRPVAFEAGVRDIDNIFKR